MLDRHSVCRLLLTIVLSQVLVIQGLLLAWSGTLEIGGGAAGGSSAVCYGLAASGNPNADGPLGPNTHHDCRSACLMGHVAGKPSDDRDFSPARLTTYAPFLAERQATLPTNFRKPVFLARAPPMLTETT